MENKTWHKKINTIALTFIAFLPIWIILFEFFRNGFNVDNWTSILNVVKSFNNPIQTIIKNTLVNVFELSVNDNTTIILSYCFGWFLFVELIEIIIMALFYFIDVLKDFFNRKENKLL